MTSPIVLTFLACAVALSAAEAPNQGRIVGGEVTSIENYPWIVQVEALGVFTGTWSLSCAANILTSRWLLSAAHCFPSTVLPQNRRIRAGTTPRGTGGVVINLARMINHPSYGVVLRDADIGVIELVSPLTWSPVIQPGTIIAQDFEMPDNVPVVHAGWGTTTQGGTVSDMLRDVTIYTINNDLCRERYAQLGPNFPVTTNMICAGVLNVGGRDACQGDSGGPLYYGEIIVGVVSWGLGCANGTYPGISAAVAPFTNWIVNTIG